MGKLLLLATAIVLTVTGSAGPPAFHVVWDLDSHLRMCVQPDILDQADCERSGYETWS